MKQGRYPFWALFAFSLSITRTSFAQNTSSEQTGRANQSDAASTPIISEENSQDRSQRSFKKKDIVSGTGFLMILPHIDVGYLSTKPVSANIFSKLESSATGYVVEPKIGFGVFSKKISLDIFAGAQIHSLTGKITGTAENYEYASNDVTTLEKPESYTSEQTIPEIEGNARIRFGKGSSQFGLSASALLGSSKALYSSVPSQGLKYGVLVGPQFVFEDRDLSNYFRIAATLQFLTTGNQRTAMIFKFGGSYGFLLNAPYLNVQEKKTVTSKVRVQKQVVTNRQQILVQEEAVSFIFDSQTINFRTNSAEMTENSTAFVAGLSQIFAAQHSDWQSLIIEGHTDSKGDAEYNKKLSQRRAESVRLIMINSGISPNQIKAIGYGRERLAINPEQSDIDFARNRRVEIKVHGLKDPRILQRSITQLQNQLFKRNPQGPVPKKEEPQ